MHTLTLDDLLDGAERILDDAPITITHGLGPTQFYRHGWTSWSPTGWTPLDESPLRIHGDPDRLQTADDAANDRADRHEGSAVGALALPDGRVLLLGALGLGTPRVGASTTELWGSVESDGDGWFAVVGEESIVFARYAALLRERLGTPPAATVTRLWCSWYSYFEDIDARTLTGAIDDLAALPLAAPLDVVQVDDGWEQIVGDWEPNPKFADGLAPIARQVAANGSRPGLWLAPFIALPGSRVAIEHPDWLVRDEAGAPLLAGHNWNAHYFALDTTHPEVREHLRSVFAQVTEWGFRYLKLDFLYAGALRGARHLDLPRERVYREAIALIREVVGPDVYLLGCGAPMIPSVGILDGVRVGPDTAADWAYPASAADPSHEGGLNGVVSSVERLWMRDLYQVDPDVAFFRSDRTTLTSEQKRTIVDVAAVTGFRSTSDPVAWLAEDERAALVAFLDADPQIERLGRYRYAIDSRAVDFTPAIREARLGRERLGRE